MAKSLFAYDEYSNAPVGTVVSGEGGIEWTKINETFWKTGTFIRSNYELSCITREIIGRKRVK